MSRALRQVDGHLFLASASTFPDLLLVSTDLRCPAAALRRDRLASEQLCSLLTKAHLAEEDEYVPHEGLGEDGVEERVGAGIERVKEHQ